MAKNVTGIVLAAGAAKIHDQPKLTLPVDGQPLVRLVVSRLLDAGVSRVVVVTGAHAPAVEEALQGLDVQLVANEQHGNGVGTSIVAGVEAAPADADGLLFMPADMPLLTAEHTKALLERFESATEGIVVPAYQKVPGFPVIVDRRHRPALGLFGPEDELYGLLADNPHDVADEHVVTDAVVYDVDHDEDYDALMKRLGLPNPLATENADAR